jgi:hypothetical protein
MWQCDAIADCRAAELLAVNDRIEDAPLTQTGVTSHASAQAFKKLFLACHGMPAQQNTGHLSRLDHEMSLGKSYKCGVTGAH